MENSYKSDLAGDMYKNMAEETWEALCREFVNPKDEHSKEGAVILLRQLFYGIEKLTAGLLPN